MSKNKGKITTISDDHIVDSLPYTYFLPTGWNTTTTINVHVPEEECSKCKTKVPYNKIERRWGWSDDPKLQRRICKKCHCQILDRYYDLDNNIEIEEVLYDKKK